MSKKLQSNVPNSYGNVSLPWPDPIVPSYKPRRFGSWRCRPTPSVKAGVGYWRFGLPTPDGWMFSRQNEAGEWRKWMSLTQMELESHQPHIAAAKGFVVVAGLGMGMYLYNILRKPDVETVVVLERDKEVYGLLQKCTDFEAWPGYEKLNIVFGDAMDYVPPTQPDYLYVDIWEHLGDVSALADTKKIQANVQAREVGYWTQEFDYVTWLMKQNIPVRNAWLSSYRRFCKEIDLPLICRDLPRYPRLAAAAVSLQTVITVSLPKEHRDLILRTVVDLLTEDSDENSSITHAARSAMDDTILKILWPPTMR